MIRATVGFEIVPMTHWLTGITRATTISANKDAREKLLFIAGRNNLPSLSRETSLARHSSWTLFKREGVHRAFSCSLPSGTYTWSNRAGYTLFTSHTGWSRGARRTWIADFAGFSFRSNSTLHRSSSRACRWIVLTFWPGAPGIDSGT